MEGRVIIITMEEEDFLIHCHFTREKDIFWEMPEIRV
jgi:hypothetical protein